MTKHSVTHPDGTVSTRVSENRVYPYAIEVRIDPSVTAEQIQREIRRATNLALRYRRLIDARDMRVRRARPRGNGQPLPSAVTYYLVDPRDGEEYPMAYRWHDQPDVSIDDLILRATAYRDSAVAQRQRAIARLAETLAGPDRYSVFRWSMTYEGSLKALKAAAKIYPADDLRIVDTTIE